MSKWVVLLRGINVGGINITMADLREALIAAEFRDVDTFLATGNVTLRSELDGTALKASIERVLSDTFGYEAWVIVLNERTLRTIYDAFPFDAERGGWHPYVVFCIDGQHLAELGSVAETLDPAVERAEVGDGVLYWTVVKGGTTSSVFGKATAKARYKPTTTTRNLRTLAKILA